ncbi:MAG: prepilin-type N-terminal cleavage/methylation domain-containing protein [Deltaproteobacteria bacterium]|nr:prepilin-type N-terminal cleavage/methylation domain-containing protein [Deltaproteobacteria bacterium]
MLSKNRLYQQPQSSVQAGHTLLEVMAVLIILGILAAVAISRYTSITSNAYSDAETLKSCIRNTQIRALADIAPWSFSVSGSTGAYQSNGVNITNVTFVTTGISSGTVTFDNRGRPSGNMSFTISGYPTSITITNGTGYVP